MQFTAQEIAALLQGTIEGDPTIGANTLSKIEEAESGSLAFLSNPRYESFAYTTKASILIVSDKFKPTKPLTPTLVRVKDPRYSFSILLEKYNSIRLNKKGIENPCYIHPSARIGKDVYIGAFAYIGEHAVIGDNAKIYPHVYIGDQVTIGHNSTLFSGVKIYYNCSVGSHVIIHSNAVIGSDGFGFVPQDDGTYSKVSQTGIVIIEDDVEIGANTTVDRATLGTTLIQKGVKLDNLIQIAHNVEIGSNTIISAQTGISGSTKVGKNVIIGGQVGVVGHVSIADDSQIAAKSGVSRTINEKGKKWAGTPVTSYSNQMRVRVLLERLPDIARKVETVEKELGSLLQGNEILQERED